MICKNGFDIGKNSALLKLANLLGRTLSPCGKVVTEIVVMNDGKYGLKQGVFVSIRNRLYLFFIYTFLFIFCFL